MSITDTGVLTEADMAMERAMGMPEELIRQEYYVDFSAANVGAIVGRYIAEAERSGRINADCSYSAGSRIVVSCDIGYRDAAAFWFWQINQGGFQLVSYMEDSGLDAGEWIDKLKGCGIHIDHLYLPHDATAKTFQTRETVIEQFAKHFQCSIVPRSKLQDRINAARVVVPRCEFNEGACVRGLEALRAWAFKWDEERKVFSSEPDHNWASHGSDAFSYGAQVVQELVRESKPRAKPEYDGTHYPFSLTELFEDRGKRTFRI
jgi:phage terminase large subunit